MPSLSYLHRRFFTSSRKLAEKQLGHARQLLSSQEPADINTAIGLLDTVLKLFPHWEKALELKARALLCLRRFKDVANLLHESIPSLKTHPPLTSSQDEETAKLLPDKQTTKKTRKLSLFQCFPPLKTSKKVWSGFHGKAEREQWKYIVLGQACCHLGMMEDAMILLSNGKRAATAAFRKQSSHFSDDSFYTDIFTGADTDLVSHLLGNIKLLLRRRTAALAALEAGMYNEAARNLSKIIDGRRGTPQGFIAECYMYRAMAYQALNRMYDAIADCNKSLVLNPICAEALSMRATLYETIGCFADALQDLEQLKNLYETVFRSNLQWVQPQSTNYSDLQGCIDFIINRATSVQERMNACIMVDYYRVLGVSRGCSRADIERSYMMLSLKHRPDKAAHFVDRCEFVDERDIEAVKDEARTLGLNLFRLLQKAYTWSMSFALEEEMRQERTNRIVNQKVDSFTNSESLPSSEGDAEPYCDLAESLNQSSNDANQSLLSDLCTLFAEESQFVVDENSVAVSDSQKQLTSTDVFEQEELDALSNIDCLNDMDLVDNNGLFSQSTTCREVAKVNKILPQVIQSDAWMASKDWNHQTHSPHPLPVT